MKCTPLIINGQRAGFICRASPRRKKCKSCATPGSAIYQCDWKLTGAAAGKTCDADLCAPCATQVAPEKHLCPAHLRMWERHPSNPRRKEPATP